MSTKLVTTIIPCYNYSKWITQAMDSVVEQDYPYKRIVVVDDGSTDGSTDKVLAECSISRESNSGNGLVQYTATYKDVQVVCNRFEKNHGPSFARNFGIKMAWEGTDYFGILDADDIWKPGRISKCLAKFEEAPDHIGLVYTDYETLNSETLLKIREFKEPYEYRRLLRNCIVTNACFISKQALGECGLYDEEMRVAEDWDLFLRIGERFMIVHIPESLVYIRVGNHNTTHSIPKEVWGQNWRRVAYKAQMRSKQRGVQ